jgi:hypothetical protein
VEVGGSQQQRQHAHGALPDAEIELAQKAKAEERGQHSDQDVGAVTDDDVTDRRVSAAVSSEDRKALDIGSHNVGRQHEQRLSNAIPALKLAVAAVNSELRVFVGEDRRLRRPECVG